MRVTIRSPWGDLSGELMPTDNWTEEELADRCSEAAWALSYEATVIVEEPTAACRTCSGTGWIEDAPGAPDGSKSGCPDCP